MDDFVSEQEGEGEERGGRKTHTLTLPSTTKRTMRGDEKDEEEQEEQEEEKEKKQKKKKKIKGQVVDYSEQNLKKRQRFSTYLSNCTPCAELILILINPNPDCKACALFFAVFLVFLFSSFFLLFLWGNQKLLIPAYN